MIITKKLTIYVVIILVLTPLGIFLPEMFQAGSAWGEWSTQELSELIGYTPLGLSKLSNIWYPVFPDYNLRDTSNNLVWTSVIYVFLGIIGSIFCYITSLAYMKLIR